MELLYFSLWSVVRGELKRHSHTRPRCVHVCIAHFVTAGGGARYTVRLKDRVIGECLDILGDDFESFEFNTIACACHLVAERQRVLAP